MVEQHRAHVMADRRIRMARIGRNDALPAHAFLNFRALGWALVTLMILAGLLGLMAVGS
jgi:hypothetical protein